MSKLTIIYDYLSECGICAEIRSDRIESYINIGNVNRVKERVQFWIPDHSAGVDVYIGTDMGIWYSESQKSPYLNSNWRYSFKENQLRFPTMDSMKEFVNNVLSAKNKSSYLGAKTSSFKSGIKTTSIISNKDRNTPIRPISRIRKSNGEIYCICARCNQEFKQASRCPKCRQLIKFV